MMTDTAKYRYISNIREEGFPFYLVLLHVVHFYTNVMGGHVRHDGPDSLIKYSRDWEYPWVLIKSEIQPNYRILDCGSGYSPLPFIWSTFGAEVHAIDKDVMICSKFTYALHWLPLIVSEILRFAPVASRVMKGEGLISQECGVKNFEDKNKSATNTQHAVRRGMKVTAKAFRHIGRIIGRAWKPDFWGPVSPGLLRRYGVSYRKGDLTDLPYEDDHFDVVSCVSVLEHMSHEDQSKGIREMSRVVREDGKLIITYDKREEDLTDRFIEESGMTPAEMVYFIRPDNLYNKNEPDVIGICLVKQPQ